MTKCSKEFALGGAGLMAVSAACGGQVYGGAYGLSYDDALGRPTTTLVAGVATYEFPSFVLSSGDGDTYSVSMQADFAASLTASPGHGFSVRPDGSFPAWAAVRVSDFLAYPYVPPGSPGPTGYTVEGSWGSAWGDGQGVAPSAILAVSNLQVLEIDGGYHEVALNSAAVGAQTAQVEFALKAVIEGRGAQYVRIYCGPYGDSTCDEMFAGADPIHVEARFTPVIVVDTRFVGAVPEPASLTLLLCGLGVLSVRARRHTMA